ncbi:uncharacterized protein LOC120552119 isoform X2 [Lates japonicus]
MRGLILLCLIGFIHLTSTSDLPLPGSTTALGNKDGFKEEEVNVTTNSSMAPVESRDHNETVLWNGTRPAIENNLGFPPPPDDGEDTQGNTKK